MSEIASFQSRADREYREYVRLVEVMNDDLTFENARAAAKQWWRFMEVYDSPADDGFLTHKMLEPHKL